MIDAIGSDSRNAFTSTPHSSLKTAVGTLLAVGAPLDAHIALMDALKACHKTYWTVPVISKRKAMIDGVHVQTLSTMMDHMAHAYVIPIDNRLSGEQLHQLFLSAGPVFVERFAKICGNYTPSSSVVVAFENLSSKVSSNVVLRVLLSKVVGDHPLLECLAKNTTLNQIIDAARAQDPDNLQSLEMDSLHFPAMCFATQSSDPKDMDRVVSRRNQAYTVVKDVAASWVRLFDVYPNENLSPVNAQVLQKCMVYCQPQYDLGISENTYGQLQNALLRAQIPTTSVSKNRKI